MFSIFLGIKMGNKCSSTAQNIKSFMLDAFISAKAVISKITSKLYSRNRREDSSPLMNCTRCRQNCGIEFLENGGLNEKRKRNVEKNWQLAQESRQIERKSGKCEKPCNLNKLLDSEESNVPPPLPPRKNGSKIRRFGVSYEESEKEGLLTDILRQSECFSNRCVSITDERSASNSSERQEDKQSITNCEKHTVKRFSQPSVHSGCLLAGTTQDTDSTDIIDPNPQILDIPIKYFETLSHPALRSGGTVIFGELSERMSIPNIYAEKPIVCNYLPENFEFPPISPQKELTKKQERKHSGSYSGGRLLKDNSSKVSLPSLNSFLRIPPPRFQRSMSGGYVSRPVNADQAIFSDHLSMTFRCGEKTEVGNWQKSRDYFEKASQLPHSNENGLLENIFQKVKSETENCRKTDHSEKVKFETKNYPKTDHSKNESTVTAKDKNQMPASEISRMIEETLKYTERNMM